nr:hypothetical protein [Rickettsia tamurae]
MDTVVKPRYDIERVFRSTQTLPNSHQTNFFNS